MGVWNNHNIVEMIYHILEIVKIIRTTYTNVAFFFESNISVLQPSGTKTHTATARQLCRQLVTELCDPLGGEFCRQPQEHLSLDIQGRGHLSSKTTVGENTI